jgi:hypothetical protein
VRRQFAVIAAATGAALLVGTTAAPAAQAVTPNFTVSSQPTSTFIAGDWSATISPNATVVHITLPAELPNGLQGGEWTWDEDAPVAIPDGATSFDIPIPYDDTHPAPDAVFPQLSIDSGYDDADSTLQTEFGIDFTLSSHAGPSTVPVALVMAKGDGQISHSYGISGNPTVTAGSTVEVTARPGFFTHGPDGTWKSPSKPILTHYYAKGVCPEICLQYNDDYGDGVVSADGSSVTFKAPAYDASHDPSGEAVDLQVTQDGSVASGIEFYMPLTLVPAPKMTRTTAPTISGTPQVGVVLTAKPGTWSPTPTSYAYQWYRDGKAVTGATKATYTPAAADLAHKLSVRVTAAHSGYTSGVYTTASTAAVRTGVAPKATTAPSITGTRLSGHTLTAHRGTWSPAPSSYTYQWYRSGKAIKGATRATYKITSADRHHKLSVTVRVKLAGRAVGAAQSKTVTIG